MLKRWDIPLVKVESLVGQVLAGSYPYLRGQLPHIHQPPLPGLFEFLGVFVKKFSLQSETILTKLVEWLSKTQVDSVSALLEVIIIGVDLGLLKENLLEELVKTLLVLFDILTPEFPEEIVSSLNLLTKILAFKQSLLAPIETFFDKIKILLVEPLSEVALLEEGEEEDAGGESVEFLDQVIPSIAQFVLSVYSTNPEIAVDEDLLIIVISHLPIASTVKEIGNIVDSLIEILGNSVRFESILVPGLIMFTEILLLKKSDLDAFEFDSDTIKSMKAVLKSNLKDNQRLQREVTKSFSDSRAKMNRFRLLIR